MIGRSVLTGGGPEYHAITVDGVELTDVRELAVGGMAIVERATMRGPHGFTKQVVVKRLRPELADHPELVRAFVAEARLAARADHPNIAHVYQLVDDGNELAVVMELVRGWQLRELVDAARRAREPMPFEITATIGWSVAWALHHVHELEADGRPLGVVHRDVSPTNVMVTPDGGVKLLDFGIAKAASSGERTQIGLVKGTASYMSPEQCLQGELDRRSDLFALGTLMYEMATLTSPFARPGQGDQTVMERIVGGRCARPSELVPGCPPELEAAIMRSLAPARELRFPTAQALAGALEEAAVAQGALLSPIGLARYSEQLMRPRRRPGRDPDATVIGAYDGDDTEVEPVGPVGEPGGEDSERSG